MNRSTATATLPAPSEWLTAARGLVGPAVLAGLLGGAALAALMVLVMGIGGMGYATPFNLGMAAFVFTITPPLAMLPTLMAAMGIRLPAATMAQLVPALRSGHISAAMAHHLGTMLLSMHVPPATVRMMGLLMTGHATSGTVVTLLRHLPSRAQNMVMASMPVSGAHVLVGLVLHFAFAALVGVVFTAILVGLRRIRVPGLRTGIGLVAGALLGGILLYLLQHFVILPPINPMLNLAPQVAFFFAHVLFGLVAGSVLLVALRRDPAHEPWTTRPSGRPAAGAVSR